MDTDVDWLEASMSICSSHADDEEPSPEWKSAIQSRQATMEMRLEKIETEMQYETEQLKSEIESVKKHNTFLISERENIRNENEAMLRNMTVRMDKDMECFRKEREDMHKLNDDLTADNRKLNSKFQRFVGEFKEFKFKTSQQLADKNRMIEKLQQQNKELERHLVNTKRRLTTTTTENKELNRQKLEMKIKLDEKVMALQIMNNRIKSPLMGIWQQRKPADRKSKSYKTSFPSLK